MVAMFFSLTTHSDLSVRGLYVYLCPTHHPLQYIGKKFTGVAFG